MKSAILGLANKLSANSKPLDYSIANDLLTVGSFGALDLQEITPGAEMR